MATQQERSERTRAALIGAARGLFEEKGFAETPAEEIVAAAGLTRGALYHHYSDKTDLFRAVLEQLHQEVVDLLAAERSQTGDEWEDFLSGGRIFLERLPPATVRLLMIEGPAVLGYQQWRELDDAYHYGRMVGFLDSLVDCGDVEPQPVEPLARTLIAAINSTATLIAEAEDMDEARRLYVPVWERMLSAFRTSGAGRRR